MISILDWKSFFGIMEFFCRESYFISLAIFDLWSFLLLEEGYALHDINFGLKEFLWHFLLIVMLLEDHAMQRIFWGAVVEASTSDGNICHIIFIRLK